MVISETSPHLKNFSSNCLTDYFINKNVNLTEFFSWIQFLSWLLLFEVGWLKIFREINSAILFEILQLALRLNSRENRENELQNLLWITFHGKIREIEWKNLIWSWFHGKIRKNWWKWVTKLALHLISRKNSWDGVTKLELNLITRINFWKWKNSLVISVHGKFREIEAQ